MTAASSPASALLEVEGLEAWYGSAKALHGISFSIRKGEATVLLGRNGAGKSTTLKALMGLEVSRRGLVRFEGREIQRLEPHRIARLGLGFVAEDRRIFAGLTVAENLAVGLLPARPGMPAWTEARILDLFPPLAALMERRGGNLSGGEQQMLAIARTLMGNPRVLLLDEPYEGLAPVIVERIGAALVRLKAEGLAMLVAEQSLDLVAPFADRALVLETGALRFSGSWQELRADPAIVARHLGIDAA